jgi:hypothetical protein
MANGGGITLTALAFANRTSNGAKAGGFCGAADAFSSAPVLPAAADEAGSGVAVGLGSAEPLSAPADSAHDAEPQANKLSPRTRVRPLTSKRIADLKLGAAASKIAQGHIFAAGILLLGPSAKTAQYATGGDVFAGVVRMNGIQVCI